MRVDVGICEPPYQCRNSDLLVTSQGQLLPDVDALVALAGKLASAPQAEPARTTAHTTLAFLVDARVPWRSLAPLVDAVARGGATHLAFGFVAGRTHAAAPAPSSIDAKLDASDAAHAAAFERDPGGTFERALHAPVPSYIDAVYARCPQARQLLADLVSGRIVADDKVVAIAELLPDAVAACRCQIEIPALERLLWRLMGRDQEGGPYAWVTVALSTEGEPVPATATTTWASASAEIVMLARHGSALRIR